MRNRRNTARSLYARAAAACGALLLRLLANAARRPVDSCAVLAASATSVVVIVNAVFLQSNSRSAPFLANPKTSQFATIDERWSVPVAISSHSAAIGVVPQSVAMRREDSIADLIRPSPRIAAVQRALSDFGYGQIEPSGILDDATIGAVEKFERERKLPINGEISDRLIGALSEMVGHPLQ